MGLRTLLERFLARTTGEDRPPPSTFGPDPRAEIDRRAREELEREVELQKGRPRGF